MAPKRRKIRDQTVQNDHEVLGRMGAKAAKLHPRGPWSNCPACLKRIRGGNYEVTP